jgi:hypothetical protein
MQNEWTESLEDVYISVTREDDHWLVVWYPKSDVAQMRRTSVETPMPDTDRGSVVLDWAIDYWWKFGAPRVPRT